MSTASMRARAAAALLMIALSGCSVVGLGYRAGHARGSSRAEAERLTHLAQMYERQGHPTGAMRLYRQALQTHPRSQVARERLMALSSQRPAPPSPGAAAPAPVPGPMPQLAAAPMPQPAVHQIAPAATRSERQAAAAMPRHVVQVPPPVAPGPPPEAMPTLTHVPTGTGTAPPLAPEPPTSNLAHQPPPPAVAPPADGWAAAEPHPLPLPSSATSVSGSAALASAAAAAAPLHDLIPSPAPAAPPALAAAVGVPATQESNSVLETPAKLEIASLPPADGPLIVVATPSTHRGWTATGSEPERAGAANGATLSNDGIEIRPQGAPAEEPTRVDTAPPKWAPTDLQRLCPSASADLLSLVRRLESPDASVRKDALIELGELGEPALPAIAAVRSLLQDPETLVQAHAAWAVCRIAGVDDDAVAALTRTLEIDHGRDAAFAAYCLGLLEGAATSAAPALKRACMCDEAAVRLCAAEALLKITPEDAEPVSTLICGLRSSEPEARWLAALSLAAVSDAYREAAIVALVPALEDAEADVCSSAALALGAFGSHARDAVPHLQAALSHPDGGVRDAAGAALACIVE